MFNRSKKYGIVKGLPFICCSNINASEFKSGKDNIKVVIDDETYVLEEDVQITNNKSANININVILDLNNVWKKGDEDDYESSLSDNLNGKKYKLVSYILNGSEENNIDKLSSIKYKDITSDLTLKIESKYKLADDSILSDLENKIDIADTEILFSDLKDLSTVEKLENFIKNKFKDKQFGDNEDGYLKGQVVGKIDFNNFFIDECLKDGKLDNDQVKVIVDTIKAGNIVIITFRPYFNYTINEIKLNETLAKRRKLKSNNDLDAVKKIFNDKYGKSVVKISLKDIQEFIEGHSNENFKKIKIQNNDNVDDITPEELTSIEVTGDNGNMVSELMKGTIKFTYDHNKLKPLNKGTKSNKFVDKIDFKFSVKNKDFDEKLFIYTTTTKDAIEASIKKYLGGIDGNKYEVTYNKGFDETKVIDDFEITVKLKEIIENFTAKLDETEINVKVKFKIENDDKNYELLGLSDKDFTLKNVNVYNDFVTALKSDLSNIDKEIKEVKIGTTNKDWSSESEKNNALQTFLVNPSDKVIEVTVVLNKNDNGTYVKKKAIKPADNEQITFKLNVTTNVNGYKVKTVNETLSVTVNKNDLDYNTLFSAIQSQIGDNKFKIMKSGSAINNTDPIDTTNQSAYSVELTQGSNFIEEDKKGDEDDKNKQNGDGSTEDDTNNKSKKCCGRKCYGDNKNKKK